MVSVALATEDELSEIVGERIIEHLGMSVDLKFGRRGNGYLRSNLDKFRELALRGPLLLLTDQDNAPCPLALIENWSKGCELPKKMAFRVVSRQIESWIMADADAFSSFLGVKSSAIPAAPDLLPDAKRSLLMLAKGAKADLRRGLLPRAGSTSKQGVGYNTHLGDFVRKRWRIEDAMSRSASLARCVRRVAQMAS
jgi:hypothetical protein